jgi:predicted DNA-binding helix-hairpin-helix protein
MIVGAADGNDRDILGRAEALYQQMGMKRVYYSAYVPVNLPSSQQARTPLLREHRVYQADWLMRFYGFRAGEILGERPNLDLAVDPKIAWAVANYRLFPLDVNTAPKELLLRVPGLGPRSVERILAARRLARISYEALGKTGAVMRRARYFISAQGRRPYPLVDDPERVYRALAGQDKEAHQQLSFLEAV